MQKDKEILIQKLDAGEEECLVEDIDGTPYSHMRKYTKAEKEDMQQQLVKINENLKSQLNNAAVGVYLLETIGNIVKYGCFAKRGWRTS